MQPCIMGDGNFGHSEAVHERKRGEKAMHAFKKRYGLNDPPTKHHKATTGIVHAVMDDCITNRIADPR